MLKQGLLEHIKLCSHLCNMKIVKINYATCAGSPYLICVIQWLWMLKKRIEAQTKRTSKIVWYLIKYLISTECEKESDNIRIHT